MPAQSNLIKGSLQHVRYGFFTSPLAVTTPEQAPLSIFDLLVLIVDQPLPSLPRTCFSDDFINLCAACLRPVNTDRPSLEELQQHAFVTTVAGLLPVGANRRSSIRFREGTSAASAAAADAADAAASDFNMDDIAFYLSHILPPHDGIG